MENNPLLIIRIGALTPRTPVGSQCSSVWPPCFEEANLDSQISWIFSWRFWHTVLEESNFRDQYEGQMTGTAVPI